MKQVCRFYGVFAGFILSGMVFSACAGSQSPAASDESRRDPLVGKGFVPIPAGTFLMGSSRDETERIKDEEPQHEVSISAFYMGTCEVTQAEWIAVMGENPSYFKGDTLPVEQVSWYDCIAYCNKKSIQDGLTPCYSVNGTTHPDDWGSAQEVECDFSANGYRLPTEAEWEYACRAGTATEFSTGDTITQEQANFCGIVDKTTVAGSYPPNAWGLYDMHGNLWEWCWDWYDEDYYGESPETDPSGPTSGDKRVMRGGAWGYSEFQMCSTYRSEYYPQHGSGCIGFRIVCRP